MSANISLQGHGGQIAIMREIRNENFQTIDKLM